jgi:hypothetical protein
MNEKSILCLYSGDKDKLRLCILLYTEVVSGEVKVQTQLFSTDPFSTPLKLRRLVADVQKQRKCTEHYCDAFPPHFQFSIVPQE